ncbi:potassium/sodium hyperpolarization-activated cyclic nucleotide-gated channel 2-like [Rattus norvegicus]|uniref:potassium/sodium hyperpolarization-activated cyclic nucleotide-gated channel 2-like n=1 Tax=Rattus norvegicus TaxID=10116 RepID=UPI002FD85F83
MENKPVGSIPLATFFSPRFRVPAGMERRPLALLPPRAPGFLREQPGPSGGAQLPASASGGKRRSRPGGRRNARFAEGCKREVAAPVPDKLRGPAALPAARPTSAAPPASPPARPRLTEPRGPAAPPRRRFAPLSAPCLPSAGWARRLRPPPPRLTPGRPGPPRGLGRAPPAPAPHPASPPRQARGRRLRAAALGRHLRRAARSPPAAATTPGPPPRAAEPPRPHASGRPRPAGPRPLGLRLQRSASSAPATPAAGEEARHRGHGHEHARGGRKERAHGRLARGEASPAVVPGKHVHGGGRGWGPLGEEAGSRVADPGLALWLSPSASASCWGAKIPELPQEKASS